MSSTLISWTDTTDNIISVKGSGWWCRRISDGCDNCYAAKLNQNTFFGGNKLDYSGQPPELILKTDIIAGWKRQTKPKKHFVASMTDVFGEWVPLDWQLQFLDGMRDAPKQTFQLLTKRSHLMKTSVLEWLKSRELTQVPDNIWLGVSAENQRTASDRLPHLLEIPCAVRFVSCEPLLEEIDLNLASIDWVIVGGESGKLARNCHVDWIESIVNQCTGFSVPVFVKQLGYRAVTSGQRRYTQGVGLGQLVVTKYGDDDTAYYYPISDHSGSKIEDFPDYLKVRQFPLSLTQENANP